MADENLRSRHAFGSYANVLSALEAGKIDEFDVLFLDGDTEPKIGWIDKNKNFRLVDTECVVNVEELPSVGQTGKVYIFNDEAYFWNGKEFVNVCKPTDVTKLESQLQELKTTVIDLEAELNKKANSEDVQKDIEQAKSEVIETTNAYVDEKAKDVLDDAKHLFEKVKYEITNTPIGTLVDYREKEIRVMCPTGTVFTKQSVGETGNANMYYMGFKAYAPEGAVSFKEGDRGVIVDEMFTFDSAFAGTDEFGRNYSICWLALASYDEKSDTWTYFGKNSSTSKYIGWNYIVEWYNADGIVIGSDSIRINLSNEECHYVIEPYYVHNIVDNVDEKIETVEQKTKTYTDEQIEALLSSFAIVEF